MYNCICIYSIVRINLDKLYFNEKISYLSQIVSFKIIATISQSN